LRDTLRRRDFGDRRPAKGEPTEEQKMVDVALAADLLHSVRHKLSDRHLIVCDDDDLWPAVVTALEWQGQVKLLRVGRDHENKHLDTGGIVL